MAFRRPGTNARAAFGLAFDTDSDAVTAAGTVCYNKNARLHVEEQRKRLPIAKCRREILFLVETRAVTIIVGETGCGKTTQIPQFLLEAGWAEGKACIACTQPRRVAAMTVAARVAEERGTTLGTEVGYSIRFEEVATQDVTKIKYLTDGVLLKQMMEDPLLLKYSVVMVDEAHERSIASDILLSLLRKVQQRRPELRVIVASATLEADKLKDFFDARTVRKAGEQTFNEPAIITVPGRTYPVQTYYLDEPTSDYLACAVQTVLSIDKGDGPGDILVFFTSQEECEKASKMINEEVQSLKSDDRRYKLMAMPLYAGLQYREQLNALAPAPRGYRKAICSTNVAETSVTAEGVVYVVDCCYVKTMIYNPRTGLSSLLISPISKASAVQRAGRAGRTCPGHAFRLCTESHYEKYLEEANVPEILRSELSSTVLQLKALGIDNFVKFRWLDAPPPESMARALEHLHVLEAMDDNTRLTRPVGFQMSELPLEPALAKCMLKSEELGCGIEMTTIAALLSIRGIWINRRGQMKPLDTAKNQFAVAEGDLITYLNVYKAWEKEGHSQEWCQKNFINHKALLRAQDIKKQLTARMWKLGIRLESCGDDVYSLMKCIACGYCMSAAKFEKMDLHRLSAEVNVYRLVRVIGSESDARLRIHPSSVLSRCPPACLVFHSVDQDGSGYFNMRTVTCIEAEWLIEMAPHLYKAREHTGRAM